MSNIKLQKVRLSFPSLFQRAKFEGKEGKYEATLLIPKSDTKTYTKLKKAIQAAIKEAKKKIPEAKWCLQDGDDKEYDGYEDHWALKASNNKRPTVIDRDKTPLTEDDERVYAGCYVNAIIDFWIQDNQWGKRVNANLYGIQFSADGEPFGNGPVDVTDDFDELEDEDDDDLGDDDDDI